MEYFNQITSQYLYHLKHDFNKYKLKLEILTSFETVIGEIVKDISITAQGQININYQQLTRRSCNLTLINVDKKYTPNENRWFWINRKFKLWIGLKNGEDTYWFSQGVYYTLSANGDSHVVNIMGTDKGSALDGSLKLNMLDGKYVIETGSTIRDLVRNTLMMNDGVSIIDPTPSLIDRQFNDITIQTEISLNDGEHIGSLFTQIGESYGADVYYDTDGRFNMRALCDGDRIDGYQYMPSQFDFDDTNANYSSSSVDYSYDCVNTVTVYTNISAKDKSGHEIENVSYTAYNKNPFSPVNIYNIGIRRMDSVEISYIDSLSPENMKLKCKQYANYLLKNNSMQKLSTNFNCIIIPHLDVNQIITITDHAKELDSERFVVQSITIPLSAGEMTVQAVSIAMLPSDTDIEMER